jgi:hypothetical protein
VSLKFCAQKRKRISQKISLSRQTITRRVDDIGKHIEDNSTKPKDGNNAAEEDGININPESP